MRQTQARSLPPAGAEAAFESDRCELAPHPRATYSFFGHAGIERNLLSSYRAGRLPQALLIAGPRGIGKATLAWRLARFLLANSSPPATAQDDLFVPPEHAAARQIAAMAHPDLILLRREWNPDTKKFATQIQADDVRRATHLFQQSAGREGYRICILDCADDLNTSSANALLKVIEEPPPRSLFLIVAHRPGKILPTLRSRCFKITLRPLAADDLRRIATALGPPWQEAPKEKLEAAISRAQGSVETFLRLLDDDGLALDETIGGMLNRLPQIDWSLVHDLADRVAARGDGRNFEAMLAAAQNWLDAQVRAEASAFPNSSAGRLAPYAQVWEKLAEAARETETLNLDRRPFVLFLFAELAAAARTPSL
ncbi:MAG TPA: DNA polymerase III subunit delta' [Methylocella sp.]|nr:DNA polymerase III subunit delta' [Methylocella sp.]